MVAVIEDHGLEEEHSAAADVVAPDEHVVDVEIEVKAAIPPFLNRYLRGNASQSRMQYSTAADHTKLMDTQVRSSA